jgi:hypothetical protein
MVITFGERNEIGNSWPELVRELGILAEFRSSLIAGDA